MNPRKSSNMMTFRCLFLALLLGSIFPGKAQAQEEVDVTKLLADTKTFIFNNNKNTVKGYIYTQLEGKTACCGQDRIYLEVKIDPSGYVLQVKPLTGKNDCYMQAAGDIIKNIKWDAGDFKGPKSVYFEIKPNIDCNDRNNNYAQVPIFNNEKLDSEGNRIYASNPRPSASETPQPSTAQPTQPVATTPPAVTTPKETAPAPVASNTQPDPIGAKETPPATVTQQPVATPPVAVTPQQKPTPSRSAEETLPMTSTVKPSPIAAADKERQAAKEVANQQSLAREEEIRFLKEQLVEMREREELLREQRLADERAARESARAAEAYTAAPAYDNSSSNADYVGKEGEGGLWFADSDGSTSKEGESGFAAPTDPPKVAATEEERLRQQMVDVENKIREMEQKQLERERIVEQQMMEKERDNDEILRLVEQKLMLEEDMAQRQEDKELDQLNKERSQIEDATARTEDESQRLMDELARLTQELNDKMAEINDKKAEIQNMSELQMRREQEIQLERAIREKQREAELLAYRMNLQGNSSSGINIADGGNAPLSLTNLPPNFLSGSPEDSTKLIYLLELLEQMRSEMQTLQRRIIELEGGDPNSLPVNPTSGSGTRPSSQGGVSQTWNQSQRTTSLPPGVKSAADDTSWEGVDNGINLPTRPAPQPQQVPIASSGNPNQPRGDVKPDISHRDTHANVAGPRFEARTYAEGESAVKEKIKTQLRSANVCGLAQAAFSVTLRPDGTVESANVLVANKPQVQVALMNVVPSLKFNSVNYAYKQVVYLDFKADVACDGVEDNTNLKEVNPLIK